VVSGISMVSIHGVRLSRLIDLNHF